MRFSFCLGGLLCAFQLSAAIVDAPFLQDSSVKFVNAPELQGAVFQRLAIERDGIVYVLTDRGVARLFDRTLALDKSFRPLAGKRPLDIALGNGQLYYLYDDLFLSNGQNGKPLGHLPPGKYQKLAVDAAGTIWLAGRDALAMFKDGKLVEQGALPSAPDAPLCAIGDGVCVACDTAVIAGGNLTSALRAGRTAKFDSATVVHRTDELIARGNAVTALAARGEELLIGTHDGYYAVNFVIRKMTLPLQTNLPAADITCLLPRGADLWVGTTRGAFRKAADGFTDYYASKRWLADDYVIDLQADAAGNIFVLTRTGLSKIQFQKMTLAEKAAHYEKKIRQRHIRFGLCSELRLLKPGDITSAEMIDTDNDGTWSSYYMASQAFKFAVTGDPDAQRYAWETFAALERLQTINPLDGFPARTFERRGFKFSDPERWHEADADWEWKAHTSSDEITDHTFGYAVLYECAATTAAQKQRIAGVYDKIISHILRNNLYLVDVDGKPTLWGRWNPEYVNWYPPSIVDRRLNSAEIIAFLEFAYKITGKELYKTKAFELLEKHGYLENILTSMKNISATRGFIFRGEDMGNEWNHSDDQLGFDIEWVLQRYAFNDDLKRKFAATTRDHWELERRERNPIWNFITGTMGMGPCDPEGGVWTLRQFPLDLITWRVENSHRRDITKLPKNFRQEELVELLPADERQITRWNTHPFILNGGDDGRIEFAGDEFLLPYWMGRYLKVIK